MGHRGYCRLLSDKIVGIRSSTSPGCSSRTRCRRRSVSVRVSKDAACCFNTSLKWLMNTVVGSTSGRAIAKLRWSVELGEFNFTLTPLIRVRIPPQLTFREATNGEYKVEVAFICWHPGTALLNVSRQAASAPETCFQLTTNWPGVYV
jgi:hypothetical protein